ncbi:MAG TPA: FtsQ-type POTRA domain-containing protein [Anaerolineae bacterium]|nr:FtsQ-type POTRA domain-containing protein [Anaerolineae bacterium]
MRINLADEKRDRGKGKKRRGQRGRRRSRTYNASITLSQSSGSQIKKPSEQARAKESSKRKVWSRRQPAAETPAPSRRSTGVWWRAIARRVPATLILAALIAGAVYASTDARFFVYDARITGVQHLTVQQIYEAAGVHEQNIFWLDPQEVARRIIQVNGIRAVRVRFELPAQVSITVEEREPVVMWRATTQNKDHWLDGEGVVLPYHGDLNSPDMVFVVDFGERHLKEGDRIEPKGITRSALQLAAAVPGVRIFSYQPGQGLSFTQEVDGGQWPVYVGTSEDLPQKIQVLQALTEYVRDNHIQPRYVDVRWPAHPVYGRPSAEIVPGGD